MTFFKSHQIDVKPKVVIELLNDYTTSVLDEAEALAEKFIPHYGGEKIVDQLLKIIRFNSAAIRKYLSRKP